MKKEKKRVPRRNTLFFKYFANTMAIIVVTIVAIAVVFLIFLANYWTGTSVDNLQRNVLSVSNTAGDLFKSGKAERENAESNLILCNSLTMVSNAIDADVFMTNLNGDIILCKDLLNSNMEVVNQGECVIHEGFTMPQRILLSTGVDGYYTMDTLDGLYDDLSIVVGTGIYYNNSCIGYIYAVTSVSSGLGPYISGMTRMFFGASVISIVVALIMAYIFSYGLTKPLQDMARITHQYARGDFSQRIKFRGNNEITDLAKALNEMAESLAVLEDSRKSFVANVSHELKTPMTSIGGFIDGILDGTIKEEESKFYLKIVSKEVKRLSTLVVTMLTLSKIEAGEAELKHSDTDMNNLLFNALLSFEKSIDESKIQIQGFEDLPAVKIKADEKMLYQVAYNLFDNAVKFTNEGGKIIVKMEDEPTKVTVYISNTGRGISKEELTRVFERFYKVDKSRSEHVMGVGLGLNLAKNIVELHGGEIHVTSVENELTTFSFWIPKK
ncbi:MAG: HAMP domain-containing sensor histidine kinase [Oscillospiraceae bacterium]|nr:HAMP domain-containing sensor histidine kinase [Oscillospiraceae bacterium]